MNCFNHRDKPAIGVCKSCGKGLCEDCLAEVPNGLACKGSCEARAETMRQMAEPSFQTLAAEIREKHTQNMWVVVLCPVIAFSIVIWSYFDGANSSQMFALSTMAMLTLLGVINRLNKYPKPNQ